MNIIMFSVGSEGDIRPHIALGKELTRRGHHITISAFASFEKTVLDSGLAFSPISGSAMDMTNNLLKSGSDVFRFFLQARKVIRDLSSGILADAEKNCRDADAIICTFAGNTFHSIAEKYKIPCIQTQYFPMDPNPEMPIAFLPALGNSRLWNLLSYRIGYAFISLMEICYVSPWRKKQGLPRKGFHTKPDYRVGKNRIPVIYNCNPPLFPHPDNWSSNIYTTGEWLEKTATEYTPSPELTAFLNAGEKPVCIGFGSTVSENMEKTFRLICEAVDKASVRAIILGGWSGFRKEDLPENIFCMDRAPHDWLFRQVCAAVHHGGAGTTKSSLRAGLPTLIIPFGNDQPFWGARVHACSCGPKPLHRKKLTADALAERLRDLTQNEAYRKNAAALGEKMRSENGVSEAADIIEKELAEWKPCD